MATFADEGDDWAPKKVAAIALEPGDTLIMPPAEIVPHAVLTLEDSHMVGGMFMDAHGIVDSAQKLLWIATHPEVTNEAIPLQFLSGWEHLRDLLLAKNQSVAGHAKFDEISELLRKLLVVNVLGRVERGVLPVDARCRLRKIGNVLAGAIILHREGKPNP